MTTILAMLSALAVTFIIAMFLISAFDIQGGLLGAISQLILAFVSIEFYKLLTT